jgi:hypothetical protein
MLPGVGWGIFLLLQAVAQFMSLSIWLIIAAGLLMMGAQFLSIPFVIEGWWWNRPSIETQSSPTPPPA